MIETTEGADPPSGPRVAVLVAACNQAHFLGAALASAERQTRPADEVIVVDDGSVDDPASVIARFPGVRLIRQDNQGLAAARNTGLAATQADYVIFLDSDDRLAPGAIRAGLACLADHPDAAFAYGAHRRVDAQFRHLSGPHYRAMSGDSWHAFLSGNLVGMTATAMFDRAKLAAAGGFDPSLQACEDYELFLRLAREHEIVSHGQLVAEYRIHDAAMSADAAKMLDCALAVHTRYRPEPTDKSALAAWREGRHEWRRFYAMQAWRSVVHAKHGARQQGMRLMRKAPWAMLAAPLAAAKRRLSGSARPVGAVDLGDIDRVEPVSRDFGFDRGTPVDRYYIEQFLAANTADIRGHVLEIGDDAYCRSFGTGIERQEVLHVDPQHPGATLAGDLAQPETLPDGTVDCAVLTQTLHLVHDVPAGVRGIHRMLAPGGVALVTVPGVSSIDRGEWRENWQWSFTEYSARRAFADVFGAGNVACKAFGNVYAATCFLQGLAVEEVRAEQLDQSDAQFPVIIAVRAVRAD